MARNVAADVMSRSGMSAQPDGGGKDRDADGGGGETEREGIPATCRVLLVCTHKEIMGEGGQERSYSPSMAPKRRLRAV